MFQPILSEDFIYHFSIVLIATKGDINAIYHPEIFTATVKSGYRCIKNETRKLQPAASVACIRLVAQIELLIKRCQRSFVNLFRLSNGNLKNMGSVEDKDL